MMKTKDSSKAANKTKANKPTKKTSKGRLGAILGHSVVSVVRAMGKHGWELSDAKTVLDHLKIPIRPHTLRMALKRGRDNDKTRRIAKLSKPQLDSLRVTPKAKK